MAAQTQVTSNLRLRRSFGKIKKIIEIPNLIEIQKRSYEEFLQADVGADQREDKGLQSVFKSVFPIKDFNETASLEFVSYELGTPKYDVEECHQRGMTFAAPIKVKIQLVIWDVESGRRSIKNVKEQEVYFGEIPLMTGNGTFMVNGTERVIVSQLHRSPGVFFEHDKGRTHSTGKLLYSARIIPYRGSWIDFEFDPKDILYVRIDRRRKFPATVLLRALGMTTEDLLNYYYKKDVISLDPKGYTKQFEPEQLLGCGLRATSRIPSPVKWSRAKGASSTRPSCAQLEAAKVNEIPIALEEIVGRISAHDVIDSNTGEVLLQTNEELTEEIIEKLRSTGQEDRSALHRRSARWRTAADDAVLRTSSTRPKTRSSKSIGVCARAIRRRGNRDHFFNNLFFNPGALRPFEGRPLEAEP